MLQVLSLNDLMKGNDNISKIPKLTALIWEKLKEVGLVCLGYSLANDSDKVSQRDSLNAELKNWQIHPP